MTRRGRRQKDEIELPPLQRGQHDEIVWVETRQAGVKVAQVVWQPKDSLNYYALQGWLGEGTLGRDRLVAGMLFRLSWTAAGRSRRITARYGAYADPASQEDWSTNKLAAERRYSKQARALARRGLLDIALTCCCHGEWIQGRGKVRRLNMALDTLIGD